MFAKFVVLILVFGATGVGVLSVRQSRLQSVHEMAESRHRTLQLSEKAGEIRTLIVRACTPQRIHALLETHGEFVPASKAPAQIELMQRGLERDQAVAQTAQTAETAESVKEEQPEDGSLVFTLEDGTRVVFVTE
ncbi:MAG: hypothetical protein ACF8LL_15065 [Phycisphaerales bacterium]